MMPFIVLIVVTLTSRLLGFSGVAYLDGWGESLRRALELCSLEYCNYFCEYVGEPPPRVYDRSSIFGGYSP